MKIPASNRFICPATARRSTLYLLAGLAATSFGYGNERVSLDSMGNEGLNGQAFDPRISQDGRYVVFESSMNNLVPGGGDTNSLTDIFVYDRDTEIIERVSLGPGGIEATGGSSTRADVSADGRFVVFESNATNLVPDDTNGKSDIFLRDRENDTTTRLSVNSAEEQSNDHSNRPVISADGLFVAFGSAATNLIAVDANGEADIFVRDLVAGTTGIVSVDSNEIQTSGMFTGTSDAAISDDGRFVSFESVAGNLVPGDTNSERDIFVRDRQTGTTERVSIDSNEVQGAAFSENGDLSGDGRFVSFSTASALVPEDTNGFKDVFVRDRLDGTTRRASVSSAGLNGNMGTGSNAAAISDDGRHVVFESNASNLVPGDSNGIADIFVRDMQANTTLRVSVDPTGNQLPGSTFEPQISGDGNWITFYSPSPDIVPGDTNGATDIFVKSNPPPVAVIAPDCGALRAPLLKKISTLKKKARKAQSSGKGAKAKKIKKQIKKLNIKLRNVCS